MQKVRSSSQFIYIPNNGIQKALNWQTYKAAYNKIKIDKQINQNYQSNKTSNTINTLNTLNINSNRRNLIVKLQNQQFNNQYQDSTNDKMTYNDKKCLISSLNTNLIKRTASHHKIKSQFKITHLRNIQTSIQNRRLPSALISDYTFSNIKRAMSRQGFSSLSNRNSENKDFVFDNLKKKVEKAAQKNCRIIGVIFMKRFGLRYRYKYCLLQYNRLIKAEEISFQIKKQIPQFSVLKKIPYLFHLGGQPINDLRQNLKTRQYIIIVDFSPKLDLQFQAQMQLFDQAGKLQQSIRNCQREIEFSPFNIMNDKDNKQLERKLKFFDQKQNHNQQDKKNANFQINSEDKQDSIIYDWQKITDVKKYVDEVVQNPQKAFNLNSKDNKDNSKTILKKENIKSIFNKKLKGQLNDWLNMKFEQKITQKNTDKNPLFDVYTHYPKQVQNDNNLIKASFKIQQFERTKNKHQFKSHFMDNMLQKIKRETYKQSQQEKKKKKLFDHKLSQKEFMKKLDKKNILLSQQNVPYVLEKYGINRAQLHNLYSVYKTFQKISAMRNGQTKYSEIFQKGIDRKTFDEGMVKLKINPGQQVIRNICFFPDFITWEQFIKIISISLRKTPQQKLEAILQGIGGAHDGYLTPLQIDIMVGSSILKIFNQQESQLKQYFVSVVMKQLDPDGNKKISIQTLKQRVLGKQVHQMDIVSFLMLNS